MAIGAVIAGGAIGAIGASRAADTQADAANNSAAGIERADLRAREDLQPFRELGTGVSGSLLDFVQAGPETELTRTAGFDQIQNSAAANGKLRSGGTLKSLTQFNNQINEGNRNQRFNELFNTTSLGSNAAARQATNTLNSASQVGSLTTQAGNARASGIVGATNAITGGINNASFLSLLNR